MSVNFGVKTDRPPQIGEKNETTRELGYIRGDGPIDGTRLMGPGRFEFAVGVSLATCLWQLTTKLNLLGCNRLASDLV